MIVTNPINEYFSKKKKKKKERKEKKKGEISRLSVALAPLGCCLATRGAWQN